MFRAGVRTPATAVVVGGAIVAVVAVVAVVATVVTDPKMLVVVSPGDMADVANVVVSVDFVAPELQPAVTNNGRTINQVRFIAPV